MNEFRMVLAATRRAVAGARLRQAHVFRLYWGGMHPHATLLAALCFLIMASLTPAQAASVQVKPSSITLSVNQGSFNRKDHDFFDISWSWGGGLFRYQMKKLSGGNWVSTNDWLTEATSASYTDMRSVQYDADVIKALTPGTYTATFQLEHNMGSASPNNNMLTVTLTVLPEAPSAADHTPPAVAYNGSASIDLSPLVTNADTVEIMSLPSHGAISLDRFQATYSPSQDYFGPDSFTYRAVGPGGASTPATVSLTVTPPPAPSAANYNTSTSFESPVAIDLSGSVSGVATGIDVVVTPGAGTAVSTGMTVTYTPQPGFHGIDSYVYVAHGPGGQSAQAVVTITVLPPPPPTASDVSTNVPYESGGTAIDLSVAIAGVYNEVLTTTLPGHGSVSISGATATYVPAPGYYGPDAFSYVAVGPGGSSHATVNIIVATPAAPVASNTSMMTAYGQPTSLDLGGLVAGVFETVAISASPSRGAASISGTVLTYQPAPGFIGTDSLTYTATGPGGTSAPATITISVAAPPPPQSAGTEVEAHFEDDSATIDLSPLVTGVFDRIEIVSQPAHGSVVIRQGLGRASFAAATSIVAIYTPAMGFHGEDSFSIRAVGPGGASAPSQVKITVQPPRVIVRNHAVETRAGAAVTIDVADGAQGGPYTGASILNVTPTGAGTATAAGNRVTFAPAPAFTGTATLRYALSNAYGTSEPATITVTVNARPDPSRDKEVVALLAAQTATARRFADAQIVNFSQRLETLRRNRRAGSVQGIRIGLAGSERQEDDAGELGPELAYARHQATGAAFGTRPDRGIKNEVTPISIWTGGYISLGDWSGTATRSNFDFATSGVSVGVDYWLSDNLVAGLGVGYGRDSTHVGDKGTTSSAESWSLAAYGSWQPVENAYLDGLLGYGKLSFDSRRHITDAGGFAEGQRSGDQLFGSFKAGYELRSGEFYISPYGGLEMSWTRLDAFAETGGPDALSFQQQQSTALNSLLGVTVEYGMNLSWGTLTPSLRAEWRRNVTGTGAAFLSYADWTGGPVYQLSGADENRDRFRLGLGLDADLAQGLSLGTGYDASLTGGGPLSHSFFGRAAMRF